MHFPELSRILSSCIASVEEETRQRARSKGRSSLDAKPSCSANWRLQYQARNRDCGRGQLRPGMEQKGIARGKLVDDVIEGGRERAMQ